MAVTADVSDDPFRFDGRVALVTGGTRGIGLATAMLLGDRGARLVISSRKAEACASAQAILAERGIDCVALPLHAGEPGSAQKMVDAALDRHGRIDIAIANAAINPVFDSLTELAEASLAKVMEVNLVAPIRLARAALPHIAAQSGAMVVVSSVNAAVGVPGAGAYGVSKAALEQMVRQLAVEWGPKGVRVNAVAPGTTRTDMIRALTADAEFVGHVEARTPMQRLGDPEDVAAAIVFFAARAARHVTGQVLRVDGGELIARYR